MRLDAPSSTLMVFRVDAAQTLGAGHVMRCLTIADAARERFGYSPHFVVGRETLQAAPALQQSGHPFTVLSAAQEASVEEQAEALRGLFPDGCAWLVVDHYGLDQRFEAACKRQAKNILVIDDLADRPHHCDVLCDSSIGRVAECYQGLVPEGTSFLLGPAFSPVRPQFRAARCAALRRKRGALQRVLVAMGGATDPHLLRTVLEIVDACVPGVRVDVLAGARVHAESEAQALTAGLDLDCHIHGFVENVAPFMAQADVCIGAGGTTSWERCCLGLPATLFVLADNQLENARALDAAGAAVNLGPWGPESQRALQAVLKRFAEQPAALAAMSEAAARLCDGRGVNRILGSLAGEKSAPRHGPVHLRLFEDQDVDVVYEWQCAPGTRDHCRIKDVPTYAEHRDWARRRMDMMEAHTYIISDRDGRAQGMVRLDPWNAEAHPLAATAPRAASLHAWEVSIVIAPEARGVGLASTGLALLMETVPGLPLIAEVAAENTPSVRLFRSQGFVPTELPNIYGYALEAALTERERETSHDPH